MIEVEIRGKAKSLNSVRKTLKDVGATPKGKKKQVDKIFGHPMFLDSQNMIIEGGLVARIRQVNTEIKLEFKEILRQSGGIEIQAGLDSMEEGIKLLDKLKFNEAFTVAKERESYSYKEFTICLDEVEQLGSFVEIEKMISIDKKSEKDKARNECLDLLKSLAPKSKIENKKYGDLMQERINKEKRQASK